MTAYGARHRWLRRRWSRRLRNAWALGQPGLNCSRCKKPILRGQQWDLGHADAEVTGGPEHAYCNRSAGARLK